MIPDKKPENDAFSSWLWVLIVASFLLGIWNLYLHTSCQEEFVKTSTFLVANIAILSTIIIVGAFIVTVTGIGKLESIKEKAEEIAEEKAIEATEKIVKNVEKVLKDLEEVREKIYTFEGGVSSEHSRPSGSPDKGHEDENKGN